jgi:hypothetical protein
MLFLLLPLADVAIAGFNFISAHEALRDMGQRVQYSPPPGVRVADTATFNTWQSQLPTTVGGYPVSVEVYCATSPDTLAPSDACTPTIAKYYKFTTSFSLKTPLSPLVRGLGLCSTCTVTYSEPFQ